MSRQRYSTEIHKSYNTWTKVSDQQIEANIKMAREILKRDRNKWTFKLASLGSLGIVIVVAVVIFIVAASVAINVAIFTGFAYLVIDVVLPMFNVNWDLTFWQHVALGAVITIIVGVGRSSK